jgi:Leucine-rich repeat (LRR) protein
MLNTFDNAERQTLRRKERERYLVTMDHILQQAAADTNSDPSQDDGLIDTTTRLEESSRPRRRVTWRQRALPRWTVAIMALGTILVVTLLVTTSTNLSPKDGTTTSNTPPPLPPNNPTLYNRLFSLVLDWEITPRAVLENKTSAASRALDWLVSQAVDDTPLSVKTLRTRFSLATLYYSTQAPNMTTTSWKEKRYWLSSYPVCFWHGVQCLDENVGLVQALNLSSNGLMGSLPAEVALLQHDCRSLDLSDNSIAGTIPDLSPLQNLQRLYLGSNQFDSSIPKSIYQLSLLNQLYLHDCKLQGPLSSELGNLKRLQGLALYNNRLTGVLPTTLGQLEDLRVLYLDQNAFTGGIPTNVGNLHRLVDLRLGRNSYLTGGIPTEIGQLSILQVLYLDHCQLTGGIPLELSTLLLLRQLHLHKNLLTGHVPLSWGMLLATVYLDGNRLTGRIPEFEGDNLPYLESLYLFDNALTGPLPTQLGSLQGLVNLRLESNRLTGTIPAALLVSGSSLESLYLNNNSLSGESGVAPPDLAEMERLQYLGLHGNSNLSRLGQLCQARSDWVELTADCTLGGNDNDDSCSCCTQCF